MSSTKKAAFAGARLGDRRELVPLGKKSKETCVLRRRFSDEATQWEVVRTGERFTLDATGAYLRRRRGGRR